MAGGQVVTSGQGSVTQSESVALTGIALTGSLGFVGAVSETLTGAESTSAAGSVAKNRLHLLRSKKSGGGSATFVLSGASITSGAGSALPGISQAPSSSVLAVGQGSLSRGLSKALTGSAVTMAQELISGPAGAPEWVTVPTISFVQGTASTFSISGYVSDPQGLSLTITKNAVALQDGVTYSPTLKQFVYDGVGAVSSTSGHILTADNVVSASVASFTLTSTSTQTAAPFMLGHAFRKGDVPSGVSLVLSETNGYVVVKRRWNDSSVKHAIIVGRTDLTANTPKTISILSGNPSGTALTSASIQAAAPTASVQCGALGTVNLSSLLASPFRTWVSTPEMVECHYRAAVGADTSLQVWFYVRLWAGGRMWVRAIVESGYIGLTPVTKSYTGTVTIGGTQVYSGSISHHAYSRWTAEGWIGGNPAVTPSHDVSYLISTKLVPNYWKRSPTSANLNALTQTYAPLQLSPMPTSTGDAGYSPHIGLIPKWEALYVTTGDARAYRAMVTGSSVANTYAIIRRPSTNRLALITANASVTYDPGGGTETLTSGGYTWDVSHAPNAGYVAYLVTGDYFHHETHGFGMQAFYFCRGIGAGTGLSRPLNNFQTRAVGWGFNIIGTWCGIAPIEGADASDAAVVGEWRQWLANNYLMHANAIDAAGQNQLGLVYEGSTYERSGGPGNFGAIAPWMVDFWIQANGLVSECEPLADDTQLLRLRNWMYRFIVGRLGPTGSSNYHFSRAQEYNICVDPTATDTVFNPDETNFYDSFGDVWTDTFGSPNAETTNTLSGDMTVQVVQGYWANLLPAIAYAVDHGATGADAAWARMTGASNWSAMEAGLHWSGDTWDATPIWGIVPRGYGGT
jgi:hypothetical protein